MMTKCFDCLFEVTKIVLILSHGNTQVKCGFSISNNIHVENLHESYIVVQHQVYDGIVMQDELEMLKLQSQWLKRSVHTPLSAGGLNLLPNFQKGGKGNLRGLQL